MATCDVVVVSYNSSDHLRTCVEGLAGVPDVNVIVVDNASADGSLATIADLPVERLALAENRGFAAGCNAGWRAGDGEYVLFLNPDARLAADDLARLATALDGRPRAGLVGPRIVDDRGTLQFSVRRFTRLRSSYSQAFFLHRLFPRAAWTDEVLRDERIYRDSHTAEWISGACVLVRRGVLEELEGMDEGFFLYCEDMDLCRRAWNGGHEVWFEPAATCVHEGGASAPRSGLIPVLAVSQLRYARKHAGPFSQVLNRLAIGIGCLTHILVSKGGASVRAGHARALRVAASPAVTRRMQPGA